VSQTTGASGPASSPRPKRSLLSLVTDIPALIQELFHREVELLKAELVAKLKALGVGAGLLVGAAVAAGLKVAVERFAALGGLLDAFFAFDEIGFGELTEFFIRITAPPISTAPPR